MFTKIKKKATLGGFRDFRVSSPVSSEVVVLNGPHSVHIIKNRGA